MNMTSEPENLLQGTGEESPLPRLPQLQSFYPPAVLLAKCSPFSQVRSI